MVDAYRRRLLLALAATAAGAVLPRGAWPQPAAPRGALSPLIDELERRTFDWFWETTPANGLTYDRWPSPSPCSIAAVGFALTAYGIGAERGWVPRADAAQRSLATVRFFRDAPQGPQPSGMAGYRGFFYHFLDVRTGARHEDCEVSTVDTALLLGGMLFARSYFGRDDPAEAEIRKAVDAVYARVEWDWAQPRAPLICHGWTPEEEFIRYDWQGYNEAMIVYLLALAAPEHPVGPEAWGAWSRRYAYTWGSLYGFEHLTFAPLFGHQFTHTWYDFRGVRDEFMREHGIDYFENSRRATFAQRAYAIANPMHWRDYGENLWGLTACDGPANTSRLYLGDTRRFRGYSARGISMERFVDDGTIAPTAAGGSIAFAPEIVVPALQEMHDKLGSVIYGRYGFLDAFNRSFHYDGRLAYGHRVPDFGWVDNDYLGIDQGPIVAMIENHRSDLVWRTMRADPAIRLGLERAGFTGGWLGGFAKAA